MLQQQKSGRFLHAASFAGDAYRHTILTEKTCGVSASYFASSKKEKEWLAICRVSWYEICVAAVYLSLSKGNGHSLVIMGLQTKRAI